MTEDYCDNWYALREAEIARKNRRLQWLLVWLAISRWHFKNYDISDRIKRIIEKRGAAVRVGKNTVECDNWCFGRLPICVIMM